MGHLLVPARLYGRDRDITKLVDCLANVSSGHGEILLVPGASGVGKTALVAELEVPTRDRSGIFIRGKFDQYQRNLPYCAFRQALGELCRELLRADPQHGSAAKRSRGSTFRRASPAVAVLRIEAPLGTDPRQCPQTIC